MYSVTSRSGNDIYKAEITDGPHTLKADVYEKDGGTYQAMKPGQIFLSSIAACMTLTTRRKLDARGIRYNGVQVKVDMTNDNYDDLTFWYDIQVDGDITAEQLEEVKKEVYNCNVCRMMRAAKTFIAK